MFGGSTIYARSVRAAWPALLVVVVVYLCFMHKAFNIDDVTFLSMADHMRDDPLHPASVQVVLNGAPAEWLSKGMWSGPVMPTLLVPSVAAGGVEWIAHLAMLVVFMLGIVATTAFALRLDVSDRGARWAAVLTAVSPAVLGMAMTCMPDVPCMSFGVLGAERLLAYRTKRGLWRAVLAAVALSLCMLSRQHGALSLGCIALLVMSLGMPSGVSFRTVLASILRDRAFWCSIATMFVAVALVIGAYGVMRDDHGSQSLATVPLLIANLPKWRLNLPNLPAQWVVSFPLGLVWLRLHGRRMIRNPWCWGAAAIGVYLASVTHPSATHPLSMTWQAPITALGCVVLTDIVVDAWRRSDLVDLALAAWLLIALPTVVYGHLPPKYLVPSAPAMAVLIIRNVERQANPPWRFIGLVAAACLTLGVLIVRADESHGEVGRVGGNYVAAYRQLGHRVYFDGGWGFQWYAQQAGGIALTPAERGMRRGDIVVAGFENWVIQRWTNKILLQRIEFREPGGRVMQQPAGFFSNGWGPLPWRWSSRPHRPIDVWLML